MTRSRTQYLRSNPLARGSRTRINKISEPRASLGGLFNNISGTSGFIVQGNNVQFVDFKNTATIKITNSLGIQAIQVQCQVSSNASGNRTIAIYNCNQAETFVSIKPGDYMLFICSSDDSDSITLTLSNEFGSKTNIATITVTIV